jgi:hypothetical protein
MSLPLVNKEEIRRLHAEGVGVDAMMRQLGPGVGRKRVIETLEELGLPRYGIGQRSPETGKRRAVRLDPATGLKKCSKCKKDKPEDAFQHRRATHDGLDTQCRDCRAIYGSARRGTEKHKANWTTWRLANLDRVMFLNARRRASEKSLPFTITVEDIHIPDNCPNCGCRMAANINEQKNAGKNNSPSLDRYDPKLGYTKDNTWVICLGCNGRKQNMSGEDHIAFGWQLINAFKKVGEV